MVIFNKTSHIVKPYFLSDSPLLNFIVHIFEILHSLRYSQFQLFPPTFPNPNYFPLQNFFIH